jgi:hypothetical protein
MDDADKSSMVLIAGRMIPRDGSFRSISRICLPSMMATKTGR